MPQATKPHSLHIAAPPFCSKDGMRIADRLCEKDFSIRPSIQIQKLPPFAWSENCSIPLLEYFTKPRVACVADINSSLPFVKRR